MKSSNIDKMVTGMRNVPLQHKCTGKMGQIKSHARRSYRREANQNIKQGKWDDIPKTKLTDWDIW